jgi:hypothetical protein
MKEFWDKVLYFRQHLDELPKQEEKPKRTRKKKEIPCEIEIDPDDTYLSD